MQHISCLGLLKFLIKPHTGNFWLPNAYPLLKKHHSRNNGKRSNWFVGFWLHRWSSEEHFYLHCKCLMCCTTQTASLFFRHKAVKHILPGPEEDWLTTHLRVETIHQRIMVCGYQLLLAKCQGKSKLPLGNEKVLFSVIKGGEKFRRSRRQSLCHRDDVESNTDILHLYEYVILETSGANLVPNKDKLP